MALYRSLIPQPGIAGMCGLDVWPQLTPPFLLGGHSGWGRNLNEDLPQGLWRVSDTPALGEILGDDIQRHFKGGLSSSDVQLIYIYTHTYTCMYIFIFSWCLWLVVVSGRNKIKQGHINEVCCFKLSLPLGILILTEI